MLAHGVVVREARARHAVIAALRPPLLQPPGALLREGEGPAELLVARRRVVLHVAVLLEDFDAAGRLPQLDHERRPHWQRDAAHCVVELHGNVDAVARLVAADDVARRRRVVDAELLLLGIVVGARRVDVRVLEPDAVGQLGLARPLDDETRGRARAAWGLGKEHVEGDDAGEMQLARALEGEDDAPRVLVGQVVGDRALTRARKGDMLLDEEVGALGRGGELADRFDAVARVDRRHIDQLLEVELARALGQGGDVRVGAKGELDLLLGEPSGTTCTPSVMSSQYTIKRV